MKEKPKQTGQVLIEAIVAIAIIATTLVGIVSLSIFVLRISGINVRRTKTNALAQESFEALRLIRDGQGSMKTSAGEYKNWNWNAIPSTPEYFRIYYETTQTPIWVIEDVSNDLKKETPTSDIYRMYFNETENKWEPAPTGTPSAGQEYFYRQIQLIDYDSDGPPESSYVVPPGHTLLCHAPPGSPNNKKTIVVTIDEAQDHLNNHPEDYLGACDPKGIATPDHEAKLVLIKVSFWDKGNVNEVSYRTMLTNWRNIQTPSP